MEKTAHFLDENYQLLQMPKHWELEDYGIDTNGSGDSCWRTALYLIAIWNDDSISDDIKFGVRDAVIEMLTERKRWIGEPIPRQAGCKRNWDRYDKYVDQRWFTKDQMIMGITALYLTGHYEELLKIDTPWFLSSRAMLRPSTYYWIKHLKIDAELRLGVDVSVHLDKLDDLHKFGRRFHIWTEIDLIFNQPSYATHLQSWMLFTCGSRIVQNRIIDKIGGWNLLIYLLCDAYDLTGDVSESWMDDLITDHKSRAGFCWQDEELWDGKVVTQDNFYVTDGIELDKIVLRAVFNQIKDQI